MADDDSLWAGNVRAPGGTTAAQPTAPPVAPAAPPVAPVAPPVAPEPDDQSLWAGNVRGASSAVTAAPAGPAIGGPGGMTDAAARGGTFGLSDVVGAAGTATADWLRGKVAGTGYAIGEDGAQPPVEPGWGEAYQRSVAQRRAEAQQYASEHPYLSALGSLAGALVSGRANPSAAVRWPMPGLGRQLATGGGTGAVTGAAGGFAESQQPGGNWFDPITGAGTGGFLGTLLPLVPRGIGTAVMHGIEPAATAVGAFFGHDPISGAVIGRTLGNAASNLVPASTRQALADALAAAGPTMARLAAPVGGLVSQLANVPGATAALNWAGSALPFLRPSNKGPPQQ